LSEVSKPSQDIRTQEEGNSM